MAVPMTAVLSNFWMVADAGMTTTDILANPRYEPLRTQAKHGDTLTMGDGTRYTICREPDGSISLLSNL